MTTETRVIVTAGATLVLGITLGRTGLSNWELIGIGAGLLLAWIVVAGGDNGREDRDREFANQHRVRRPDPRYHYPRDYYDHGPGSTAPHPRHPSVYQEDP